jgi:hypothetical protein
LGDSINTVNKKAETLINASKEAGLEVNTENNKCKLLSRHQNAGQNHDIKTVNRSYVSVAQFKYLRTTVTDQNSIQEKIKRRSNWGNAWYHSVQNLLSSHLLSYNVNIRIYKSVILPVVLYGCGTWSQILRKKYRLKMFENIVVRRMFGSKRNEIIQGWRTMYGKLHNWFPLPNVIRMMKSGSMRWTGCAERMAEKGHTYRLLQQNDIDGKKIGLLKWIIEKQDGVVEARLIWVRIWTSGSLF